MIEKMKGGCSLQALGLSILLLFLLVISPGSVRANGLCTSGLYSLQGDADVVQGRGGIWGHMEKFPVLRDQSVLGLQVDSKLRRMVVLFEIKCEEGKADIALFNAIQSLAGDARMLFNLTPNTTPKKKVLEAIEDLLKRMNDLIDKTG